jgi:propionate CoA-transferase
MCIQLRRPRATERITFSADYARAHGQRVLYVTERAVFRLDAAGIRLIELAPGIEIERDILPYMEFKPLIGPTVAMDPSVFV